MAKIKIKSFKLAGRFALKAQAKVIARIQLLEELGHEIRRPPADMVDDGIYELRERFIRDRTMF
jgi:hypothetical protein